MYKHIIIIVPTILWEIFTETLAIRVLFHLRQALLLHVMRLDAVAITLLGHDIGQAHVLGVVVLD
jgi:hypothetical protein